MILDGVPGDEHLPRHLPGIGPGLCQDGGTQALGVVVFASRADADRAAQGPRGYRRDGARAWNIEDVTLYEQAASA